jgi:hypothetical protein
METLTIGKLTFENLALFIELEERPMQDYPWTHVDHIELSTLEHTQLRFICDRLLEEPAHLLNEATIWARAIYPLLLLGEKGAIRARAEVPIQAQYPQFKITGIADGALGKTIATRVVAPFLVLVEAKRGIEGTDPTIQLYGEMLAAARLNWQLQTQKSQSPQEPQIIFGCYTIADTWTFLQGEVTGIDSDRPKLTIEYSQEYTQKHDSVTVLKLIKSIVAQQD